MIIGQSIDVRSFYGASGQAGSCCLQGRAVNRTVLERFVDGNEEMPFVRNTRHFLSLGIDSSPSFGDGRKA